MKDKDETGRQEVSFAFAMTKFLIWVVAEQQKSEEALACD
jgi:hypothetical protein